MEGCIFCSIAKGEVNSYKIYEDGLILGVLDINPTSLGHSILFTKKHYNNIFEIPQEEYLHLMSISRAIAFAIEKRFNVENVDILYSKEINKGVIIPHAIVFLIPRYKDDKIQYYLPKDEKINLDDVKNQITNEIEMIKAGENQQREETKKIETKTSNNTNNESDKIILPEKKKKAIA